jgi:arginine/lysine/ornithine decarboxylase
VDRLYDQLLKHSKEDYYPMHMPGHKRNTALMPMGNPYEIDITEIEGFDNLHQAEGILKHLSERIKDLYHAGKSYPLINGSTAGILAAITAATKKGDKILMARNCHKAVYHAVILRELEPVYLYPRPMTGWPINGGILAENIEELLINNPEIKLVVITSPTYEGIVSDIAKIADIVHRYNGLLLVDEAHGAHFGFHDKFPQSAVTRGADFVIQSLHKTLPSFTQTAVLHSNRPEFNSKLERCLAIFQSSSPSYLLMAGMDRCISLLEEASAQLFSVYYNRLSQFRDSLRELKHLLLFHPSNLLKEGVFDFDLSKITISTGNCAYSGHQLAKILREDYKIVIEMEARNYVLGMTSICDTAEGFERFFDALCNIDRDAVLRPESKNVSISAVHKTEVKFMPYEAVEGRSEVIELKESSGRVSSVFVCLFPPGSPLLVPGEIISEDMITSINQALAENLTVTGLCGDSKDGIEVID